MLFTFLQMGTFSIGELLPFIIMGVLAAGDILLLKLGLVVTKAQKRTQIKWVAGSFAIQFGIIFVISSPLFMLVYAGRVHDELGVIIPFIVLSLFINLNVINVLHQVGLKRSFVILLLISIPIILILMEIGTIFSKML